MKTYAALFCVVLACSAPLARADEASQRAAVEELLKVMRADEMMNNMMAKQKEAFAKMIPSFMSKDMPAASALSAQEMQSKIMDAVYSQLTWESLKPDFIQIYAEVFTEKEIKDLTAFYGTPLGQKLLEKMPELTGKSMQIMQKRMVTIMPEMQKIIKETIQEAKSAQKPSASPAVE
jgi:hypothetical protein